MQLQLTPVKQKLPTKQCLPSNSSDLFTSLSSPLLCSLIFDKSFIWFEETIYRRLLEILSFLELMLLIIIPFVASGMFVSPMLVKAISFFSFYHSLWTKAARSLLLFPRRHGNRTKTLLRGLVVMKLHVKTRMVCKLTDCDSDLSTFH